MTSASMPTAYMMHAATVSSTAMTSSMSAAVSTVTKYNRIPKADQEKTYQPA
jgi:hypothetical protein